MSWLKWMSQTGVLPAKGRLLDIGESCLLDADAEDIVFILQRHGGQYEGEEMRKKIESFAYRSRLCGHPTIPTLFLSEVMELTQVEYVSLDIVSARVAKRFDLNYHRLARNQRNRFDLVLNFGTTEHVMNQFNAFRVIHEATRVGGYMFHQLPSTGYINHGYFNYNALMFKELAEANGYQMTHLWFDGPLGQAGNIIRDNSSYSHDVQAGTLPARDGTVFKNNVDSLRQAPVPNSNICVLLQKQTDKDFAVGNEVKTAAGLFEGAAPFDGKYTERPLLKKILSRWTKPAVLKTLKQIVKKTARACGVHLISARHYSTLVEENETCKKQLVEEKIHKSQRQHAQ